MPFVNFEQLACKWPENDKKTTHQPETHESGMSNLNSFPIIQFSFSIVHSNSC